MPKLNISIPDKLYKELAQIALEQNVSINDFVNSAIKMYLEQLDRESFKKSFQRVAKDKEMLEVAEEGMKEYFEMLCNFDKSDESEKRNNC